jgi:hypothetical protein
MFATKFVAVNVRLFRSCVHAMVVRRKIRDVKGVALGQNSPTMSATFGGSTCSAAIPALPASKPTGRRSKRSCNTSCNTWVEQSFIAKPIPIDDLFVVGD